MKKKKKKKKRPLGRFRVCWVGGGEHTTNRGQLDAHVG